MEDQKEIDEQAVDAFAAAMKQRLAEKRAAGYGGWHDPEQCPLSRLYEGLRRARVTGDIINEANYAMMIFQRLTKAADNGEF